MNLKPLVLPCYWFGEIYVNTAGATKTYDGEPLTASGECHSQYNNKLFQTGIDFKVTGLQILIAIDQLINTLLGGYADETLSSRAWRHKLDGSRSWPCWIIDHLFFWQDNHCKEAYESEMKRTQLPPSLRGEKC